MRPILKRRFDKSFRKWVRLVEIKFFIALNDIKILPRKITPKEISYLDEFSINFRVK